MLRRPGIVFLVLLGDGHGQFRRWMYPTKKSNVPRSYDDSGEPPFLTPYLVQGKIDEARKLRLVCYSLSLLHINVNLVRLNYLYSNDNHSRDI